jgi:hypothetical protein
MENPAKLLAETLAILKDKRCVHGFRCTCQTRQFDFHINEINGVCNLSIFFEVSNHNFIRCRIHANFKNDDDGECPILYSRFYGGCKADLTPSDFYQFSVKLLEELPLLKLQYDGSLSSNDCRIDKQMGDVFSAISCDNFVYTEMKDCCVCYEKTRT